MPRSFSLSAAALSACLASSLLPDGAIAQTNAWQRYVVPETGASVDVPAALFTENAGRPEEGYGHRFMRADRRANLTVQSVPNSANDSPAAFLAKKHPPAGISYRRITPRFFAVSSTRDGMVWYNRCNAGHSYMNCVLVNYPVAEKRQWDGIVTRISRSLTSGS